MFDYEDDDNNQYWLQLLGMTLLIMVMFAGLGVYFLISLFIK